MSAGPRGTGAQHVGLPPHDGGVLPGHALWCPAAGDEAVLPHLLQRLPLFRVRRGFEGEVSKLPQ